MTTETKHNVSNLDLLREAAKWPDASYGTLAHFMGTTVEDLMCAKGQYLEGLLANAVGCQAQAERERKINAHDALVEALKLFTDKNDFTVEYKREVARKALKQAGAQ